MANANRPMGLSPVNTLNSGPYNGQARLYTILAANTNGFAIGDPVISTGQGGDSKGNPAITIAAATGPIRGVIVGLFDTWTNIAKVDNPNSTVRPAAAQTKDWYAMVVDDPNVVFEVQEIGTGTPLVAAAVGLNANLVAGANNGFVSGWQLNNATEDTEVDLQVKILGLAQRSDNAIGQYAKWLVKINNHELAAGTGSSTP